LYVDEDRVSVKLGTLVKKLLNLGNGMCVTYAPELKESFTIHETLLELVKNE